MQGDVENIYRDLLDAAPDAFMVIGSDELITFANLQAERLFGYERGELLGRTLDCLMPERFRRVHHGHVTRYFAAPVVRPMGAALALQAQTKEGTEFPIEVSLSPFNSQSGMSVCVAIRDVSERREFEEQLRAARAVAEAANSAKSDFLASMSHELRTPLNAILGFAQLLQRDKKEPLSTRHRDRAAQIVKGGEHLLRLIDDILDLSRIEAGNLSISTEAVSVTDVLDELHTTLSATAARTGITMKTPHIVAGVPMIAADRTRFTQILMNLASNAIKYNRPGGSLMLRVAAEETERVRVTVIDTGVGIPLEKQDKLFQPFQRAGQETGPIEGTGIGLVITKRLAEMMGGSVGFRSEAGSGSEFWVEMPVHEPQAISVRPKDPLEGSSLAIEGLPGKRVLYIEDNPANVAFMRDLLSEFDNLHIEVATTAEQGIALATGHPPDVIIMDINLPGMSGLEALMALKRRPSTQNVPVIALTAAASERDKQRGVEAGFMRYLTKPVRVHELVRALTDILA